MSDTPKNEAPGRIGWLDISVPDADALRDFYAGVVGWSSSEHDMGGYSDFVMMRSGDEAVGGICHARGSNADLPPVWLPYFTVVDLDASLERARAGGGESIGDIRQAGSWGRFCVIRDPAGAACALFEQAEGG